VQAVLGLIEDHRGRRIDHGVGDLGAAVGRQAVQEERARPRDAQQPVVHLIALKDRGALSLFRLLTHGRPDVGVDRVRARRGGDGILGDRDRRTCHGGGTARGQHGRRQRVGGR
jgi:hypothetical protein